MWIPPLLVLPLIIYNLVAFDLVGTQGMAWAEPVISQQLPSGAIWSMSVADMLVIFALTLLLIDNVRARRDRAKVLSVTGSAIVFALYGVEFALVPAAATSVFFACMAMSFVDFVVRIFTPGSDRINLPRYDDDGY